MILKTIQEISQNLYLTILGSKILQIIICQIFEHNIVKYRLFKQEN